MSFFGDIPSQGQKFHDLQQPLSIGRPESVIPCTLALELLIARNDRAAVAITGLWAYPAGFEFLVSGRVRPGILWEYAEDYASAEAQGPGLRMGIQFATGAKATNLRGLPCSDVDSRSDGPSMSMIMSGGGRGGFEWRYWVSPLPPLGPLAFVCEWPAFDIEETQASIDAETIREAAGRSIQLWPEPRHYGA